MKLKCIFRDVFLAMLSEKIRSTDFNWDDAKSKLKKDSRWNQVADLDRTEMENTFNHHMAKDLESFSGIHYKDGPHIVAIIFMAETKYACNACIFAYLCTFIENLVKDELKVKRKNAFRELLKESNVNVTSNWKEIRRKIKDDVRYQKYRNSL